MSYVVYLDAYTACKLKIGNFLWPPCVADADIVFLPCGFFYLLLLYFFLA